MNKKIIFVAESINVEDSSASKANLALIKNLVKIGFDVRVYHYSNKEIVLPSVESILITENKYSIWYILARVQRVLQRTFKVNLNNTIESILGFSFAHTSDTLSIRAAIKKDKDFNPDFILTRSKGGSFRVHRALLKLPHLHTKWIAYMHDPYPFHFYPRPYNWVEQGFNQKEKLILGVMTKAQYVAYPSQLLMEWMESYFEVGKTKGIVIPHQIPDNNVSVENLLEFFDENNFNLLHAGNLLKQRDPKYLILAFLKFLEHDPNARAIAKLVLVGSNSYHQVLLEEYKGHPNIIFKGHTAYETVQLLESKASVNIILEAISEISPFLPGKFPNLIVANQPILMLGPYYSEARRLLGSDYEYWAEANDTKKIEGLIGQLFSDWNSKREAFSLNRLDLRDYCNEVYLKQVMELLKSNE